MGFSFAERWLGRHKRQKALVKADETVEPFNSEFVRAVITGGAQGLFAVDIDDRHVGRVLQQTGAYGEVEIERASQYVTSLDNALVVGAHVGSIAIPLSRRCNHVTAIEANPRS